MILNNEIRINNNRVHLYSSRFIDKENASDKDCSVPIITKKSMSMTNFKDKFNQGFNNQNNILPDKCKYVETIGTNKIFIIEEQPAVRSLSMETGEVAELEYLKRYNKFQDYDLSNYFNKDKSSWKNGKQIQRYSLSLPYVVFIITMNQKNEYTGAQVYFRLAPLVGMGDYLLIAPFTNIDNNQFICLGNYASKIGNSENAVIQNVINTFWYAIFNNDYTNNYHDYQNKNISGVSSYVEWEILTKQDPNFIFGVNWIQSKYNIYDRLQDIKKNVSLNTTTNLFTRFTNIINLPTVTKKTIKYKLNDSIINKPLYYDITNGIMPRNDTEIDLHVGDPFYIQHEKAFCYISSFLGDLNNGNVKYLQVERNDGKILKFKFTKMFRKFLNEQAKKIRMVGTAQLKDGTVIHNDDILFINQNQYSQIQYIRQTPYNTIEVKFYEKGFYNIKNINATLFDQNQPIKFKDLEINKNDEYIVSWNPLENNTTLFSSIVMKFSRFILNSNNINLEMKCYINKKPMKVPISLKRNNIYDKKDVIKIQGCPVVRNGRRLKSFISSTNKPVEFLKTRDGITYDYNKYEQDSIYYSTLKKYIIKDNQLYIHGFDFDLKFSIGDMVVVADWDNPQNMLVHKEIVDFVIDERTRTVSFKLKSNSYTEDVLYINNDFIYLGKIRHISKEYKGLKFGDKIKAKATGIANFPKKDTNIIIGFLTDTGSEPLILCSNYCTLWYQDVKDKFEIITSNEKRWGILSVVSGDSQKIKLQPGDLVLYDNSTFYLICSHKGSVYNKPFDVSHITYETAKNIEYRLKFANFIEPRIMQKDIVTQNYNYSLIPNFHGGYTKSNYEFKIGFQINNERSIINV